MRSNRIVVHTARVIVTVAALGWLAYSAQFFRGAAEDGVQEPELAIVILGAVVLAVALSFLMVVGSPKKKDRENMRFQPSLHRSRNPVALIPEGHQRPRPVPAHAIPPPVIPGPQRNSGRDAGDVTVEMDRIAKEKITGGREFNAAEPSLHRAVQGDEDRARRMDQRMSDRMEGFQAGQLAAEENRRPPDRPPWGEQVP